VTIAPRSGYTLPVFACAASIAALRWLHRTEPTTALTSVPVDMLHPAETVEIPIEQVSGLKPGSALAITRSDPGDNLDLTRHTPIWALVEILPDSAPNAPKIHIKGGEGLGRQGEGTGEAAIYGYAQNLLLTNLERWLEAGEVIEVTIILPEGRSLAERTSNAAFGVVDGLSLLGTSGIAHPLSAPGQLELFRAELQQKAQQLMTQGSDPTLVFCIGENGLDLVAQLGIAPDRTLKTANWLGSLLVEAGMQHVESVLLFGYHGKLIKLAGGIFHTHHHVADGRQEILAAHCANLGLPLPDLQAIFASPTAEAALQHLRAVDDRTHSTWVNQVYSALAHTIDRRCQGYIYTHSEQRVTVGCILFDRNRKIVVKSTTGETLLSQVC